MDREPPPVTVTAPTSGGSPPDLLEGAPAPSGRRWTAAAVALVAVVVLGAAVTQGEDGTDPAPVPPPPVQRERTVASGITATASLAGARTDQPYAQRLVLTIDLPAFDGRSDSGGWLLGDEVLLAGARVRGFSVEPDDPRALLPLGRFGRTTRSRSTTVPATAVVDDCSVEPQARRDIVLTVRAGSAPDVTLRAVAEPDVVRALDRLVSRTCRRPRG